MRDTPPHVTPRAHADTFANFQTGNVLHRTLVSTFADLFPTGATSYEAIHTYREGVPIFVMAFAHIQAPTVVPWVQGRPASYVRAVRMLEQTLTCWVGQNDGTGRMLHRLPPRGPSPRALWTTMLYDPSYEASVLPDPMWTLPDHGGALQRALASVNVYLMMAQGARCSLLRQRTRVRRVSSRWRQAIQDALRRAPDGCATTLQLRAQPPVWKATQELAKGFGVEATTFFLHQWLTQGVAHPTTLGWVIHPTLPDTWTLVG